MRFEKFGDNSLDEENVDIGDVFIKNYDLKEFDNMSNNERLYYIYCMSI